MDLDQDGKPDVAVYGIDLSSRPGMAWMEQQDRRRTSLRNAHVMATMTQFRIGMTRMETVTALGLVTQIELALITYFRESLPEPGQNWDAQKRAREIERRLARLRWVEQQQNDEDSGLKGVWNRVRGRRKPSGKDLYRKMIENADAMVLGMEEPDRDDDVMAEALLFTGAGPEDPGFRNVGPQAGPGMSVPDGVLGVFAGPGMDLFSGLAGDWPKPVSKRGPDGRPRFWAPDCSQINWNGGTPPPMGGSSP